MIGTYALPNPAIRATTSGLDLAELAHDREGVLIPLFANDLSLVVEGNDVDLLPGHHLTCALNAAPNASLRQGSRPGHLYEDPAVGSFGEVVDLEVRVLPRLVLGCRDGKLRRCPTYRAHRVVQPGVTDTNELSDANPILAVTQLKELSDRRCLVLNASSGLRTLR